MFKRIGLITLILLGFIANISHAVDITYLEKSFVRGTGTPVTESALFTGVAGPALLRVHNGADDDSYEKVSSSIISINGIDIATPEVFNQNVNYLEIPVTLIDGENSLAVQLKSKPGGMIRVSIVQEIDAEAAAVIGPEGGIVEVTDFESELLGAKIFIKEGSLESSGLFAIKNGTTTKVTPSNWLLNGPAVDLFSNIFTFKSPLLISLPFENFSYDENNLIAIASYSEASNKWELLPPIAVSVEEKRIYFLAYHFSLYRAVNLTVSDSPVGISSDSASQSTFQFSKFDTPSIENTDVDLMRLPEYTENDSDEIKGICLGLSLYTKWFYENIRTDDIRNNLLCKYDPEVIGGIANSIQYERIRPIFNNTANIPTDLIQIFKNDKNYIIYQLNESNSPVFLRMFGTIDGDNDGHGVLVLGWRPLQNGNGEFTVFDPNDNDRNHVLSYYNNKLEYLDHAWGNVIVDMNRYVVDPIISNYNNYFLDINSYPHAQDADSDGYNDPCDNCPIISNPNQEDTDGDGIGDACEEQIAPPLPPTLNVPGQDASAVSSNQIPFSWTDNSANPDTTRWCLTINSRGADLISKDDDQTIFDTCDSSRTEYELRSVEEYSLPAYTLNYDSNYTWAVHAVDPVTGFSSSSEWRNFKTTPQEVVCTDNDGDEYFAEAGCSTEIDCDDNDPAKSPGLSEVCGDGKDNNCDGQIDEGCVAENRDSFSNWPDTGQTKCYNDTSEIPCPAEGEPFYGQDAQYNGPARSYTLLNGGTMVQDNVTGLIWEMKNGLDGTQNYDNPHDSDNTYSWCDPNPNTNGGDQGTCDDHDTKDFIDQLNSGGGFGGYTNWRMPTIKELATLLDLGRIDPAIDPIFAATTQPSYYWSSTTYSTYFARRVHVPDGTDDNGSKSIGYYVLAVRGGQVQSEDRFVDNQDGTVTDTITCLQWQKATMDTVNGVGPDIYNWQDALAASENLSLAGHSDWRLPDRNELRSLVDYSRVLLAIDPVFAANTRPSLYWSSTTSAADTSRTWNILFSSGSVYSSHLKSTGSYVRAVRGGQCEEIVYDKQLSLNDTGITWGGNYPSVNNTTCTSNIDAPQDCNQGREATHNDNSDGHAGFSFTKLDVSGNDLPASATFWPCVRDNVTGLVWEMKTNDGGIHDKNNVYRWGGKTVLGSGYGTYYSDWDSLVDGSISEKLCGYNDWRVPTLQELQGLVHYGATNSAIDAVYFPNTPYYTFWSASPSGFSSSYAWSVNFGYGYTALNGRNTGGIRVRLVRSGE